VARGVKVITTVHCASAASVGPQPLLPLKLPEPESDTLEMLSVALPPFTNKTFCDAGVKTCWAAEIQC